ncbi:MAG: hypothetical protein AAFX93_14000 [Verrucomicrobiota bacterium]
MIAPRGHLTREQVMERFNISAPTWNTWRKRSGIPKGIKGCYREEDIQSIERGSWKDDFQARYNINTRWKRLS